MPRPLGRGNGLKVVFGFGLCIESSLAKLYLSTHVGLFRPNHMFSDSCFNCWQTLIGGHVEDFAGMEKPVPSCCFISEIVSLYWEFLLLVRFAYNFAVFGDCRPTPCVLVCSFCQPCG